jgi:hypothetical protein
MDHEGKYSSSSSSKSSSLLVITKWRASLTEAVTGHRHLVAL